MHRILNRAANLLPIPSRFLLGLNTLKCTVPYPRVARGAKVRPEQQYAYYPQASMREVRVQS